MQVKPTGIYEIIVEAQILSLGIYDNCIQLYLRLYHNYNCIKFLEHDTTKNVTT